MNVLSTQGAKMDHVLHALRVKGRASPEEIALTIGPAADGILGRLRELATAGLVVERASGRRPGWMLSPLGRERSEQQVRGGLDGEGLARMADHYEAFLHVNDEVKHACACWQSAASVEQQFEVLDTLARIQDEIDPALTGAAEIVERFGRYRDRLSAAIARVEDDPRFVVSPTVDSYHTVWFECHEDFLLTLGRSRHEEGSW
jgi:hypothetical protein